MNTHLKIERLKRGLSQKEFTEMAGFFTYTYNRIENGKGNPIISTIQKLSKALAVPIESIIKDEQEVL